MKTLDKIPLWLLLAGSLTFGLAPFYPEPHLVQKLGMLFSGSLSQPIDIFDLCLHGAFPALLLVKLLRMAASK